MTETAQLPEESNVCVAVKIRPLSPSELDDGCRESLYVTPGLPQVSTGQHTFTYDHVFGEGGTSADALYPRCIAPLVAGLFKGYNATVFAYGQTGSGKTYTMGSEYKPGGRCRGVIPDAINDIFSRIEAAKDCAITVRVSFVEIHKEEVKDLLLPASSGPRPAVTIRETQSGDVALYGAVEKEVRSREEMAEVLELGTLCRSTASTNMNNRSSRSHAIFTITLEQRRQVQQASTSMPAADGADEDGEDDEEPTGEDGDCVEDFLGAKMHLVDLAGSERAKRTKAEGARLREGIHINRGLLALGNVINAIVDNHKHVPYRDSKLTRLLQDSLGGNSRTVMIACVSPADSNFEESLNTLRYADRARHIRNKPVVNRDPVAAQLAVLRNTIAQLKSENLSLKRALVASGGEGALDAVGGVGGGLGNSALEGLVERLTQENTALESENMRLKMDMEELRRELGATTDKWHTAQAQCDLLRMNLGAAARRESIPGACGSQELSGQPTPGLDIVKGYIARIAELEQELKSVKSLAAHMPFTRRRAHGMEPRTPGSLAASGDIDSASPEPTPRDEQGIGEDDGEDDPNGDQHQELGLEEEFYMELAARTLDQEKMKKEVALLQRQLEAKEQKMVKLMKDAGSMPALKQHYDRVLADLEAQRDLLMAERKALMEKLAAASAANEEERKRLEATYRERIQQYDERLKELRRKERDYIAMAKLKQRTEEAHRRLSADISRLKQQKVAVQRQLDAHAKQFAAWKQEREKEITQLRKQSRKDRAHIQHLEAMQAKQNAVLQRKISDANAARKRLKELQEANSRRAAAQASAASQQQVAAATAAQQALGGNVEMQPNVQAPLLKTDGERRAWLLKELELCNMSCEFRKVIDGELAQRAEASRKLKELEKRLTLLEQLQPTSPMFLSGAGGAMLPISPTAAAAASALGGNVPFGPEAREMLLAKKKELEDKVAHHNDQISQLQADWERQKEQEEQRGGGANDVRRWAGLRNVVECRELLRTLFRLNIESKSLCNDLTVEMVRQSEEVDVLRVQLEGAQKKCAQYRKLAMACQAAAARAVSAPHHSAVSTLDETDKQVDAVLEELHVVRNKTPPAAAPPSDRAGPTGSQPASMAHTVAGEYGSTTTGGGDVEMMDAETPSTADEGERALVSPKALKFLSPVPSAARQKSLPHETDGAAAQRYSPAHDDSADDDDGDEEMPMIRGRSRGQKAIFFTEEGGGCDMDVDMEEDDEEEGDSEDESDEAVDEEEADDSDDEEADMTWHPKNATPAARGGRSLSRRTSSIPMGNGDAGSRRASRRQSREDVIAIIEEDDNSGSLPPAGGRGSQGSQGRRAAGSRRSTSSAADDATFEAPVLDAINLSRVANNQPQITKLTCQVLKDALKGQEINGQKWHAGSKKRAELIQDYRRLLGLEPNPSDPLSARTLDADANDRRAQVPEDVGDGALFQCRRVDIVVSGEISVGGAKPVTPRAELAPAERADAENFTFPLHVPVAPAVGAAAPAAAVASPPAAAAAVAPPVLPRPHSPCQTPSGRRGNNGSALGPWARSSLHASQSGRQYTTWASSLRASCPLTTAEGSTDGAAFGPGNLARSNSGSGGLVSRGSAPASGDAAGPNSRRPFTCESPSNQQGGAALRESHSYRGALLTSPRQSTSPRLGRQSGQTATGAMSPRNSLTSTPPRPPSANLKSPGSGGWSPAESHDKSTVAHDGGENMQPGCTTPTATSAGVSSAGKASPLVQHYREKASAARERTAALRVSMQRNWEQHDPHQHPRAVNGSGSGSGRSSLVGLAGATGTVAASMDGASKGGLGMRDSFGANKQQKAIWR